jgi:HlyD family secretion protein
MMGGPMGGSSAKKSSSSTPKLVGKGVWIDVNGKAAFRPVKTGINDGVNVQITAGLAEGDSVVVRQEAATVASQSAGEAVSPFMPGPRKKKK